jgi:tRNA(His) guanylyltransferase
VNADEFDAQLREGEWFHRLRIPEGMWSVIRVDGRSFTRVTAELGLDKPFDEDFSHLMTATAEALLRELEGVYAYTESDEISVVLPPGWSMFNRSVEKTVSISAAIAASTLMFELLPGDQQPLQFDSRVWLGANVAAVVDYMSWRQSDAARCCLNGWCYWTLRQEGMSARAASSKLHGMRSPEKQELLFQRGVNFNGLPAWQRRGSGLWWSTYEKQGFNPKTQESVTSTRRTVHTEGDLPMKDDYRTLVFSVLTEEV